MKFTVGVALSPLDQLPELAKTAEECGYSSIALPDSLFFSEEVSASYPYTPDGSRFWNEETPWVDPFVAAAVMGAVTSRIRFYTQVLKLNPRNPVLLARQIGSVAVMTGNRFGLDGYRRQAEIGVTDAIVVPWVFYGVGLDGPLQAKKDGMKRFAEEIMGQL